MKNIKLYELEEIYHSEKSSFEFPTVSYTKDTDKVWYMKNNQIKMMFRITEGDVNKYNGEDLMVWENSVLFDSVKVNGVEQKVPLHLPTTEVKNYEVVASKYGDMTDMHGMFRNCTRLTSLDLSNFDTSNVTDMHAMFYSCYGLKSLDLSNFDTSNVTDMHDMFYGCQGLTSLDLSNFDTSNVTDMHGMVHACHGLRSLDLSSFDTSNVTDMHSMFRNCYGLGSLDLSSFDTSKVNNMSDMFYYCGTLTSIRFGSQADVNKVTSYSVMFHNITTTGTLYYPSAYATAWNNLLVTQQLFTHFPSTWTAVAI